MAGILLASQLQDQVQFSLISAVIVLLTCVVHHAYSVFKTDRPLPDVPLIGLDDLSPKDSWIKHGNKVIEKGFSQYDKFQIMTGTGPKMVVRNKYAEEISKNKSLDLMTSIKPDFMSFYPGFEGVRFGFRRADFVPAMIRQKLTQSLSLVTEDLVEEATDAIHDIFGESEEWQITKIKQDVLQLVARLSSRVFLGKQLCRNQRWLDIVKDYTVYSFTASRELRRVGSLWRPIKYWFLESCTELRKDWRDAKKLITEEVSRREMEARAHLAAGRKPPKKADSIAWMVEVSNDTISTADLVAAELGLSIAAIHTTSEATCIALQHLCEHPQFFKPLREEIIEVISKFGWAKTSLYHLKLMDSFLKESQRHNRGFIGLMRGASRDTTLSDGTKIPKGGRLLVEAKYWDPETYGDNVYDFDAFRFLRMREEPGKTNSWQYVSNSPEHLGFGLGEHACPGRFFVSNELKIALAHLLLKYDWTFVPEIGCTKPIEAESAQIVDPNTKLRFRRRKEEIDLGISQELKN